MILLPKPTLNARRFGARSIPMLTDDALFEACGVRIAFTGREGGVGTGAYESFNLGTHVEDDPDTVAENRRLLLEALEASDYELLVPNQVHGDRVTTFNDADPEVLDAARAWLGRGTDAVVVGVERTAALLCFADCVPVIAVSPSGRFAVIHAGWRGVANGIVPKAVRSLAIADALAAGTSPADEAAQSFNIYIGPHICKDCFETSEEIAMQFFRVYGYSVLPDKTHVDLTEAIKLSLLDIMVDPERIVDAGCCTKCDPETYFSYRASDGVCGRHGAIALRKEV